MTRGLLNRRAFMIVRCCTVSLLAATLAGCGNPLEPEGAVSITGLGPELSVGEQAQLHATDTGGPTDVTTIVRWATTTPTCLVNPQGLLTARSTGQCAVIATYGGASATATTQIGDAQAFTIRGTVSDVWADGSPIIAGATVTITSGAQAGRSTQTDATGAFTLANVPNAPVDLRAETPGLEPKTVPVSPEHAEVDFALLPLMTTVRWVGTSELPRSGPFVVPFDTHHRGPFTIRLVAGPGDCGTYGRFSAAIAPLTTYFGGCGNPSNPDHGTLAAGYYELQAFPLLGPAGRSIELIVPQ